MKDGYLSKLTTTESTNQAIQYKQIYDALPVFCTDKGYWYIDNIIHTNIELPEAAFLLPYPLATLWSNTYHVQIKSVNSTVAAVQGVCPLITQIVEKTHVFNSNLQKHLLSEYDQKSKTKYQEWAKLTADKKL